MIGLPTDFTGVIQDTASSATLCSILTARETRSDYAINGRGFSAARRFTVYCSSEAHSSIEKAAKIAGVGKENLRKTVDGFPGGTAISKKDFWSIPADILVPAALGEEIDGKVAEQLQVKLVAEGANGPTDDEGDKVLQARGIEIIPDIIANAGGVNADGCRKALMEVAREQGALRIPEAVQIVQHIPQVAGRGTRAVK